MELKILLPVGARPNFMKAAAIVRAIEARNAGGQDRLSYRLVHTGQHYDYALSGQILRDVNLPDPPINLGVGLLPSIQQIAEVMSQFSEVIERERPDVVMVVGDVNSTLACTLATAKAYLANGSQHMRLRRPYLIHVEAGLRSFDRSMPEEVNRVLTDAVSDLCYITEPSARRNLLAEGIDGQRVIAVGNTMVDTLLLSLDSARALSIQEALGLPPQPPCDMTTEEKYRRTNEPFPQQARFVDSYGLVTLHRASNVDCPDTLRNIVQALKEVAKELPLFFPVHPRTRQRLEDLSLTDSCHVLDGWPHGLPFKAGLYLLAPRGYLEFLRLLIGARIVLTDSGGIQEESTILDIPCVTLRNNTERPITLEKGTNFLAGISREGILNATRKQLDRPKHAKRIPYWDGRAGERIVHTLLRRIPFLLQCSSEPFQRLKGYRPSGQKTRKSRKA